MSVNGRMKNGKRISKSFVCRTSHSKLCHNVAVDASSVTNESLLQVTALTLSSNKKKYPFMTTEKSHTNFKECITRMRQLTRAFLNLNGPLWSHLLHTCSLKNRWYSGPLRASNRFRVVWIFFKSVKVKGRYTFARFPVVNRSENAFVAVSEKYVDYQKCATIRTCLWGKKDLQSISQT